MDGRLIVAQQFRPPGAAGGRRALRHAARTVRAAHAAGQGHAGRSHVRYIRYIRHRHGRHASLRSAARQRGMAAEHALRTDIGQRATDAAAVAFIGQDPQVGAGGPWRLHIAAAAGRSLLAGLGRRSIRRGDRGRMGGECFRDHGGRYVLDSELPMRKQ